MTEQNPTVDTKPNAVPVPADWAALGATTGYDPPSAEQLRLFVLGPSGEGKTTFVNSIRGNLILDFDIGANSSPGCVATRIPVPGYEQMAGYIEKLVVDAKAGKKPFSRITFDTVDEMVGCVQKQLEREKQVEDITEFGSQGHGYNLILGRLWSMVRELEEVGYPWAFVGHLKTKTERNPVTKKEETKLREATYPSIAKKILTRSDFKLTIFSMLEEKELFAEREIPGRGKVQVPVGTEKMKVFYLDAMGDERQDAKARGVPSMEKRFPIPLCGGWDLFASKYTESVAKEREKHGAK